MRTAGSTPHGLWRTKNRAHRDGFIPRLSAVPRHLPQAVAFVDVVLVLLSCPPPDGCWLVLIGIVLLRGFGYSGMAPAVRKLKVEPLRIPIATI